MALKNILIIVFLIGSISWAKANNVSNSTLNISGEFEQQEISPAEKLRVMRMKLEKKNMEIMKRKLEEVRVRQEIELMKKIQKTMEEQFKQVEENLNSL